MIPVFKKRHYSLPLPQVNYTQTLRNKIVKHGNNLVNLQGCREYKQTVAHRQNVRKQKRTRGQNI